MEPSNVSEETSYQRNVEGDEDAYVMEEFVAILRLNLTFNNILLSVRVVGILLNLVALRVLVSKNMTSSASTYLITLTVFDIVFLVTSSVINVLIVLDICLIKPYYWVAEVVLFAALGVGACGSIMTTVNVTMERYIAIAHPLKVKILCSAKRKTFIFLIEVFLTVVITGLDTYQGIDFYLPLVPTMGLKEALRRSGNQTDELSGHYPVVLFSCVYWHSDHLPASSGFPLIQNLILYVIPTCILSLLNLLIVRVLSAARPGVATRKRNDEEAKLYFLKSVVAVSIMSIFAYPVTFILFCISVYAPYDYISFDAMVFVEDLIHAINSSVNCLFYCVTGNKFRSVLLQTVKQCCCLTQIRPVNLHPPDSGQSRTSKL